ncbi:hypothetical protein N7474_002659 [Penicillium riverlandense]|uniref:uncharacterized protein n=1 Tax=Penicillium riverlandense TaxID=1903569 RepID=UPI00254916C4|nr:uncharacterized protein N7474_002659 [Penicillium riverlandense]KAJ5825521.1 hypothetical protein N7474_002659 [Penicillium riverlandense]
MPRLPPSLLTTVARESPLLSLLLKECRTLESARNELRWLRERALRDGPAPGWATRLRSMCRARSKGFPLQYVLGDQPFGDLDILLETEAYTFQAAKLIRRATETSRTKSLSILDLCTGTGCIALLLHALLAPHVEQLRVIGIDICPMALQLARRNLTHNLERGLLTDRASADVQFRLADVLGDGEHGLPAVEAVLFDQGLPACDLLVSNPPYVSHSDFRNGTTARSVRHFEPKLALVPPARRGQVSDSGRPEDVFYGRIITLSRKLRARITVLECGDLMQARRVVAIHESVSAEDSEDFSVEIWPSGQRDLEENGFHAHDGSRCVIIQRCGKDLCSRPD